MTFRRLKTLTGLPYRKLTKFADLSIWKFSEWNRDHSGTKRNRKVPSSNRIADAEKERVVDFKKANPAIGYRALCWMMVDRSIAFISPSSVLRILAEAGLNTKWTHPPGEPKKKGFDQPVAVHEQWHTDISYVNYKGTFVYLIAVLDGFSRSILAWDIRTSMTDFDVSIVLFRACEKWIMGTEFHPRVITDNGKQFFSKEYKMTLRESGLTHTKTAPYHPQSNGKMERFHGTAKSEFLRIAPVYSLEHMKREFNQWVDHYNRVRLHSAIGYVAPYDVLEGRRDAILEERKRKLERARKTRAEQNPNVRLLALPA